MFPDDGFNIQLDQDNVNVISFNIKNIAEYLQNVQEYRKTFPLSEDAKQFVSKK